MNGKTRIKIIIDIAMTVMLPFIMAQLITGTELHEWLGNMMVFLFVLHHVLNAKWFPSLIKGRYSASRTVGTIINLLLFVDMILLGVSGIAQSSYVFEALPKFIPTVTSKKIHMTAGWWGLVLMSLHLGMHVKVMMSVMANRRSQIDSAKEKGKISGKPKTLAMLLIAGVAVMSFIRLQIYDYLFMRAAFAYFTDADRPILYFAEMICLIAGTAVIGYGIIFLTKTNMRR